MKNPNSWLIKFFWEKVAKLSNQHFLAIVVRLMGLGRARTETPVQFTDGHDIPRGPIDSKGDLMAPIPGQLWLSDGPSLIMNKILEKTRSSWDFTCSCGEDKSKMKNKKRNKCTENSEKKKLKISFEVKRKVTRMILNKSKVTTIRFNVPTLVVKFGLTFGSP